MMKQIKSTHKFFSTEISFNATTIIEVIAASEIDVGTNISRKLVAKRFAGIKNVRKDIQ